MITRVTASGWKCGSFDLELQDTNVVCGKNGAGKTSVLDAIRLCLFGDVPGLGKQNQSLMRGATGRKMSAEIELSGGEVRSVVMERKGESVKKTASHEFASSDVPLSVRELMSLNGEQFRNLLSFGDKLIDSADYVNDIASEVPLHARSAVARCTVSGKGPVTSVNEWCRQIQDQVKRERSNLKETKGALANTQRLIEDSEPVPAGIIEQWRESISEIGVELAAKKKLLEECSENEARAINSRRNLESAQREWNALQEKMDAIDGSIAELSGKQPDWTAEEVASLERQAKELEQKAASERESNAAPHRAIDNCIESIRRIENIESIGKCDETQRAIEAMNELSFRLPPSEPKECSELEQKASQLQQEASSKAEDLRKWGAQLRAAGVTSIEHAHEVAKTIRLECAAASKRVEQLEGEVVAYEGQSRAKLEEEMRELQSQQGELRKKVVDAEEYRNLVGSEAALQESVEKLEAELDDMKLVEKAAIKVQAKYLDAPVQALNKDLDAFAEAAGVDFRIRASFERKGNTTTLVIQLNRGGQLVPIESASGGEQIIVGCAFLYAINMARQAEHRFIFVEAAELDDDNARKLHAGLELCAKGGIQGFMTSFSTGWDDAICVGSEEHVAQ